MFGECYMTSVHTRALEGEYTFFELRLFCFLAPLNHCAEANQLSEELYKVFKQLPCTFFSSRKRLLVRRLWSEIKGAL